MWSYKGQAEATVDATVAHVVKRTKLVIAVFKVVSIFLILSNKRQKGGWSVTIDEATMTPLCNWPMSIIPVPGNRL